MQSGLKESFGSMKVLSKSVQSVRRWIRKTKKIASWLPLLWNDEDFDYGYIYIVFHNKIKRTREHMEEHQFFEGWEKVAADLKTAEDALKRLMDTDPGMDEVQREADKKIAFETIRDHIDEWWC